ncbi:O-methyltransferase [Synechococcus elongatus]|uniref:Caffeoyl-CoA O-methyltransferase n=2 Tax=Synechococcus elongatus TaxID=32046 RepID=Q935X6_SYNE7|nr:class I SAM-dependent methyltransferase [Synechococcus elongatus]AAL03932.1 CamT [Synechococcus elongatus PCC 7942 = FACHB-805]ABB58535.1 Caffeoyl-CoA O-methyltransferase [Synechococcus elongatus PCC 7942 = FACHB-805]AJD57011.1 SAM-dependent methlyltransferase [Synechococcus elongatus UTEX 2973]MBD2587254.1 class I SAM-dependent methyltransferase [Synechococcus elongatus FACHB-242]MBD2688323.1 class I SAM-dependent methyltransferase [Synechococcus elongatus FACHB-1061]
MGQQVFVTAAIADYLQAMTPPEPAVLQMWRQQTATHAAAKLGITPTQSQFLALLVQIGGYQRVLELGTGLGYSALAMAIALPPTGSILTLDRDRQTTDLARQYWESLGFGDRIQLLQGEIRPALQQLQQQGDRFDFIWIDADKRATADYFQTARSLLTPKGLIAVDNVLWSGRVADPEDGDRRTQALRNFNAAIAADPNLQVSLLPLGDGITLIRTCD